VIDTLAVVGVGLIGGSLARAMRGRGLCREVSGWGRREAPLREALELGVLDRFSTDPAQALEGASLVVAAVPPGAMAGVFRAMRPLLGADTVVTDVGSIKGGVVDAARAELGEALPRFVPGHPIAGKERHGVGASDAELFQGRRVILTPLPETSEAALRLVRDVWGGCGAEVVEMEVGHHDQVLAATSHLPHLLAYGLVDCLARLDEKQEVFGFAAGGFRDFTRIASSDPALWQDICMANREHLLEILGLFRGELDGLAAALEAGDGDRVLKAFRRAKQARDRFARLMEGRLAPESRPI
jgi:prephenate dehydrogenase